MACRAKFRCVKNEANGDNGSSIHLSAVTSDSAENKEFFRWTPGGSITLQVVNPAAAVQFVPGTEYFVDFVEAK